MSPDDEPQPSPFGPRPDARSAFGDRPGAPGAHPSADDGPSPATDGAGSGVSPEGRSPTHGTAPHPADASPPPLRPGPNARRLSRPRLATTPIWLWIAIVAGSLLWVGVDEGEPVGIVLGGALAILVLFAGWTIARFRVRVDGDHLFVRTWRGWQPPVDLRRIVRGDVVRRTQGIDVELILADADGRTARMDMFNHRLVPLYRELATRLDADDPSQDWSLRRRMRRSRAD